MADAATNPVTSTLERLVTGGGVLCDGAMGTMLLARGFELELCYEELNLSRPETVANIHSAYLLAGAEMVKTNTFGANVFRLQRHGLHARVAEINRAGVQLARACALQSGGVCVAGSVGPLGVRAEPAEARAAFAEQVRGLAGVDLLMIETMMSLEEAAEAMGAAHDVAPELRLVVTMTVDQAGNCLDGTTPEAAAARLTELGADVVGCNCGLGPESVLRAVERMRTATRLPLAALPSAGLPRTVNGRGMGPVSPEEMASWTRRLAQAGASLIGGCCGTTPAHVRAMRVALEG
jgi:homocysteine S-methyltransferase